MPDHRVTRAAVNAHGTPLVAVADVGEKAEQLRARQTAEVRDHVVSHPIGVMYAERPQQRGNVTTHPLSATNMPHAALPALDQRRAYVLMHTLGQASVAWVDANVLTEGEFDARTRYFPANAVLVGDVEGRKVRMLVYTPEGLASHSPDEGTLALAQENQQAHLHAVVPIEGMDHDLGCSNHPTAVQGADVDILVEALTGMDRAQRAAWIQAFTERNADNLDHQFHLAKALGLLGERDEATRRIEALIARAPDHPQARYAQAWSAAFVEAWEEVWALLESVDFAQLPVAEGQHARHLAGLAGLRTGRWERAANLIREASEGKGRCNLLGALGLVNVLRGDAAPDAIRDGISFHLVRTGKLVRSLRAASDLLAAGEYAAAAAALDQAVVWRADELQTTARLTEAWLGVDGSGFRKWLGVAALGGARHRYAHREARNLPLPEGVWGSEKLDEVEKRAEGWLDGTGRV